jgi:hypothetical protein
MQRYYSNISTIIEIRLLNSNTNPTFTRLCCLIIFQFKILVYFCENQSEQYVGFLCLIPVSVVFSIHRLQIYSFFF